MSINVFNKPTQNGGSQPLCILEDEKLRLYADPIEGNQPGRVPTGYFNFKGNNPRFMVWYNNQTKGDDARLELNLDVPTMMAILVALEQSFNRKDQHNYAFAVKKRGWDRQNNKPTDPYVEAMIVVGKDQDGLEFMGIKPRKKPAVKFYFQAPEFHPIVDTQNDNLPVSRQMQSAIFGRAYVKLLNILVPMAAAQFWQYDRSPQGIREASKAKKEGNNGSGSNYNNYGSNNGGNSGYGNNGNGNGYNSNNYANSQPTQPAPAPAVPDDVNFDNVPF